jgi:hypothetical protein
MLHEPCVPVSAPIPPADTRAPDVARSVTVRLRGGLGNQLFQYALGRALAEKDRRELFLDDLALRVPRPLATPRTYGLHAFEIRARCLSEVPAGAAAPVRVVQMRRGFNPYVLSPRAAAHLYLEGFWQDERYFRHLEGPIRRELRFKPGPWSDSPWNAALARTPEPVCVHVRRQDYVTGRGGGFRLGFCGIEYYADAIQTLAERVGEPHFFVFSDDLPWCERFLDFGGRPYTFVRHQENAGGPQLDLRLMTLCRHFIISNSSFSWWGAWLGSAPDKLVIAPRIWFRDIPEDSAAMTPPEWLRL